LLATLVRSTKLLYASPDSTGMGDHIGVKLPVWEIYLSLTNHPCQYSLAIPPWVGTMSRTYRPTSGDALRLGIKAVLLAGNTV